MKFDLHSHSYFSDGELSPAELIALAEQCEISHLALTDHDTVNGLAAAKAASEQHNVKLINGVELSCTWNGQLLHIVGLDINPDDAGLQQGIQINTDLRHQRAEEMTADLLKHNIDVHNEVENVLNGAIPTRPHFAQALINLGLAKNKNQAFKRYLVRGKPGYVPMQWPSLEQVAEWICGAGGVAVLAHPLRYKFTRTKLVRLTEDMKQAGVQGIEVSNAITDAQQVDMLAKLTVEQELLASIGSDFHAHDQPWARLGGARPLPDHLTPVWSAFQSA